MVTVAGNDMLPSVPTRDPGRRSTIETINGNIPSPIRTPNAPLTTSPIPIRTTNAPLATSPDQMLSDSPTPLGPLEEVSIDDEIAELDALEEAQLDALEEFLQNKAIHRTSTIVNISVDPPSNDPLIGLTFKDTADNRSIRRKHSR